jgi:hypothetical protein
MPGVRQRWHDKHGRYPEERDVEAMFADFVPQQIAVLPRYTQMIEGAVATVDELQKKRGLKIGSTTGFTMSDDAQEGHNGRGQLTWSSLVLCAPSHPHILLFYSSCIVSGRWWTC